MTIKINFKSSIIKNASKNLVLFVDEKFNINHIKKSLTNSEFSYIDDLLKTSDLKKNFFVFELSARKKIVLAKVIKLPFYKG